MQRRPSSGGWQFSRPPHAPSLTFRAPFLPTQPLPRPGRAVGGGRIGRGGAAGAAAQGPHSEGLGDFIIIVFSPPLVFGPFIFSRAARRPLAPRRALPCFCGERRSIGPRLTSLFRRGGGTGLQHAGCGAAGGAARGSLAAHHALRRAGRAPRHAGAACGGRGAGAALRGAHSLRPQPRGKKTLHFYFYLLCC